MERRWNKRSKKRNEARGQETPSEHRRSVLKQQEERGSERKEMTYCRPWRCSGQGTDIGRAWHVFRVLSLIPLHCRISVVHRSDLSPICCTNVSGVCVCVCVTECDLVSLGAHTFVTTLACGSNTIQEEDEESNR